MTIKDKEVWESYTKNVAPVKKAARQPGQPEKARTRKKTGDSLAGTQGIITNSAAKMINPVAFEHRREKSLRQGEIEIEAKLDLHGLTQVEAFEALALFMRAKAGKRHLLIITGKGRQSEGILRRNLKNWLEQLPEAGAILALRPAAARHGGEGAFYVIMRKKRLSRPAR